MTLLCPRCHSNLEVEKISFREACLRCGEELHSCIHCTHYAPGKPNDCNEPQAEPVLKKDRNNLCEWFVFAGGGSSSNQPSLSREGAEELWKKLFSK